VVSAPTRRALLRQGPRGQPVPQAR